MIWLYVAEVAVVTAALGLVPWMKRAGEREWRRHRRALAHAQFVLMMANVGRSIDRLAREFRALIPPMRKAFDRVDAMAYSLRELQRKDDRR